MEMRPDGPVPRGGGHRPGSAGLCLQCRDKPSATGGVAARSKEPQCAGTTYPQAASRLGIDIPPLRVTGRTGALGRMNLQYGMALCSCIATSAQPMLLSPSPWMGPMTVAVCGMPSPGAMVIRLLRARSCVMRGGAAPAAVDMLTAETRDCSGLEATAETAAAAAASRVHAASPRAIGSIRV